VPGLDIRPGPGAPPDMPWRQGWGQGGEPDLLASSLAWGFAWAPGPEPKKTKKTMFWDTMPAPPQAAPAQKTKTKIKKQFFGTLCQPPPPRLPCHSVPKHCFFFALLVFWFWGFSGPGPRQGQG